MLLEHHNKGSIADERSMVMNLYHTLTNSPPPKKKDRMMFQGSFDRSTEAQRDSSHYLPKSMLLEPESHCHLSLDVVFRLSTSYDKCHY